MIPSGTVTFLFTDIEGSTRLWEQHPQAMRRVLARHDDLLRQEIESHGGYVFKTVGDAFCASFDVATEALASALAIQHLLLDENWGDTPIRVRMALHTGHADEREGDYFGPDVNRVARLLSTGHGGQVLLSARTAELIRTCMPQTVEFRSLGSHRLKDLGDPEHVYQVSEPGLQADFPVLNSLNTHPNNLPAQRTSFIGRETEVSAVSEALAHHENRLLTLTGPGGTGKTRLSLQVAAESLKNYADGAFFVPLAPVAEPDLVISSIVKSLGIRSSGQRSQIERLKEYLGDKEMLLVLDNYEHVVEAAPVVSDLLTAASKLDVMVTSRIPLHLYGERVYQVNPLSLPDQESLPSVEQLAGYESMQLFVDRASAVKQGFALTDENASVIAQICSRLDGLPLAIELAAARMRMFSPRLILERLENRMRFQSGAYRDLPERQRTLQATIEWSENLLSEADQILFRRLAVFAGGATYEAAETICGAPGNVPEDSEQTIDVFAGLENLLDHNLLRLSEDEDEPHFYMLETIREYGKGRLEESGEAEKIRRRHAEFYLALVETAEPELRRAEQVSWLARLEREHDNFRTALSWLIENDTSLGLRMAADLGRFWHVYGHYSEGREWLAKFLAAGASQAHNQAPYAKALNRAGMLAAYQGDTHEALKLEERSISLWRELSDEGGLALALQDYAMTRWMSGNLPGARTIIDDSVGLFKKVGDEFGLVDALFWQGFFAVNDGDYVLARSSAEECVNLAQIIGDVTGLGVGNSIFGHIAYRQGDYATARLFYEMSVDYLREVGDLYAIIIGLGSLANASYALADYERAKIYIDERLQLVRTIGHRQYIAGGLAFLGLISCLQVQKEEAHRYFEESLLICVELEEERDLAPAQCIAGLALLLVKEGKPKPAAQLLGFVEHLLVKVGTLDTVFQGVYDQAQTGALEQLGEETFDSYGADGQAMTFEQAIRYALKINSETAQL